MFVTIDYVIVGPAGPTLLWSRGPRDGERRYPRQGGTHTGQVAALGQVGVGSPWLFFTPGRCIAPGTLVPWGRTVSSPTSLPNWSAGQRDMMVTGDADPGEAAGR